MAIQGKDGDGVPLESMAGLSLASTYNASLGTNVALSLNANTKIVEVTAFTAGVFLRWGASAATTSAFDAVVPPGQTRRFKVPPSVATLNILQQAASAAVAVNEF